MPRQDRLRSLSSSKSTGFSLSSMRCAIAQYRPTGISLEKAAVLMFGTIYEPEVSLEDPTSSTRCGRSYSKHPWIRMCSGANETQQDHPFGRSSLLCQTNKIGTCVSTMQFAYITTDSKRSQIIWAFTSRRSVSLRSVKPHKFKNKAPTPFTEIMLCPHKFQPARTEACQ